MSARSKTSSEQRGGSSLDEGDGYDGPAAFPADLCDVTGIDCGPDGEPPLNATNQLEKPRSTVNVVNVDGDVLLFDYNQPESVLKDDTIGG
jgi:hypothetical protein